MLSHADRDHLEYCVTELWEFAAKRAQEEGICVTPFQLTFGVDNATAQQFLDTGASSSSPPPRDQSDDVILSPAACEAWAAREAVFTFSRGENNQDFERLAYASHASRHVPLRIAAAAKPAPLPKPKPVPKVLPRGKRGRKSHK